METKKRDKKGRVLRDGERQRDDGRYEYRYKDLSGDWCSVYSWRLVESDPQPRDKHKCEPLRDLEASIKRDIEDRINTKLSSKTTLNEAFQEWFERKAKLRASTRNNYEANYNLYIHDTIGQLPIKNIKPSTIKKLYVDLQTKNKISFGTIKVIQNVLHQVFNDLVLDDVIRKNPTDGIMKDASINPPKRRHALTVYDQNRFMSFIQRDRCSLRWYPLIIFLFGTGVRIGEAVAITWSDIDFFAKVIHVHKTATRTQNATLNDGYTIGETKTEAGIRDIPMLAIVEKTLLELYGKDVESYCRDTIDDVFVFRSTTGAFLSPETFCRTLNNICKRFNKSNENPIPLFTPHVIRHTFCVRLCEQNVNLKVVQAVMGHKSIQVTMDVYNEAMDDTKRKSFEELDKMNASALPGFVPTVLPILPTEI